MLAAVLHYLLQLLAGLCMWCASFRQPQPVYVQQPMQCYQPPQHAQPMQHHHAATNPLIEWYYNQQ